METNNIPFCRHIYQLKTAGPEKDIYTKVKNNIQASVLPDEVSICSIPENKARKLAKKQLQVNKNPNWQYGNRVTDLNKTDEPNIFEGWLLDPHTKSKRPGSLIFFEFSENKKLLVIDVFENFFTHNPFTFRLMLTNHNFLIRKKPVGA